MKKILLALMLAVFASLPFLSSAATVAEIQAMIAQLQQQLAAMNGPSIQVTSPNGGETYVTGESAIRITWKSNNIAGQPLVAYLYSPTLGHVRSVNTNSDYGSVDMQLGKGGPEPVGQYKITLCAENVDSPTTPGKPLCDQSDNYFTLSSTNDGDLIARLQAMIAQLQAQIAALIAGQAPVTNPSDPVITGVSGPVSLAVGQEGMWTVQATAPADAYLVYNVNWGDSSPGLVADSAGSAGIPNRGTFYHTYNQAGTYTITVSVANDNQKGGGNPVKTSMTVVVGDQPTSGGDAYIDGVSVVSRLEYDPHIYSRLAYSITASSTLNSKGGDSYVYAGTGGVRLHIRNVDGKKVPDNFLSRSVSINAPVVTDKVGNKYYVLKEGQATPLTARVTYDTNQMFSGTYYGQLSDLTYLRNINEYNSPTFIEVGPYVSNKVAVVGEQAPYISSIANATPGNRNYKIYGERLNKGNLVIKGTSYAPQNIINRTDGTSMTFDIDAREVGGSYPLYVEDIAGRSNTVYLNVVGENAVPKITVLYPNGGEDFTTGIKDVDVINFSWVASPSYTPKNVIARLYSPISGSVYSKSLSFDSSREKQSGSFPGSAVKNSGQYKVTICDEGTSDPLVAFKPLCDSSDNYFTINTSPTTISPIATSGACGSVNGTTVQFTPTQSLCSAGYNSAVTYYASPTPHWGWSCIGSNGGTTATCSVNKQTTAAAVSGSCGSANGRVSLIAPASNLCSAGTSSSVTSSGASWTWRCAGENGGTEANCSAPKTMTTTATNGSCGSANGAFYSSDYISGSACSVGTPSTINSSSSGWYWSCAGSNGGNTVSCSATKTVVQPAFACGSATNAPASVAAPASNLCSAGTPTTPYSSGSAWLWMCVSSTGGKANCNAPRLISGTNGTCGSSNGQTLASAPATNLCTAGSASSVTTGTNYTWNCYSTNGGTTASCSANKSATPTTPPATNDFSKLEIRPITSQPVNGSMIAGQSVSIYISLRNNGESVTNVPLVWSLDGQTVQTKTLPGMNSGIGWIPVSYLIPSITPGSHTFRFEVVGGPSATYNFTVPGTAAVNPGQLDQMAGVLQTIQGMINALRR